MVFYHNSLAQVMGSMGLVGIVAYGRLLHLNAQLDVDEKNHEPEQDEEEQEDTPRRPSVLAALEEKTNKPEPVKPFRSYYDKDGDAR